MELVQLIKLKINNMSQVKLSLIVRSHLNDVMVQIAVGDKDKASQRIRFVSWLTYSNPDLTVKVDGDALWNQFLNSK